MAAGIISSPAVLLGSALGVGQRAAVLVEVVLVRAVLAHQIALLLPAGHHPSLSAPLSSCFALNLRDLQTSLGVLRCQDMGSDIAMKRMQDCSWPAVESM